MIHYWKFIVVPASFTALFLTCYAPVLFGDRQFGYRDAAHYYYPLHRRVQHEWDAGRWPLWEPEENAGMPLLGNPTAAVLYPGKVVFAIFPYAWAARVYVMMHTALAFAAMLVLMRSWRTSRVGSALAALSYAFGMPAGASFPEGNTYWLDAVKLPGGRSEVWVPSLYLGGLTLVLACGALAMRQGPPWRAWLSVLAVVGLLASLGPFSSPLWAVRALAEATGLPPLRDLVQAVGPLDPVPTTPVRIDRFLRDGDGGIYGWLATVLPGFQQFRYPAKLYTLTAMGLAALAGLGWDSLRAGRSRKIASAFAVLLVSSIAALAVVSIARPAILAVLRAPVVPSMSGPLDAEGGFRAMIGALVQAVIVSGWAW
jgi:hypothetical protein